MIVIFMLIAIIIALTAVIKRLNDVNILCVFVCPIDELNAY